MYICMIVVLQLLLIIIAIEYLSNNLSSPPLPKKCSIDNLPNVYIFYPNNDINTQKTLDTINSNQGGTSTGGTSAGEWSNNRYALLFMPGNYNVIFQVPYYVSIIGLGKSPEEVTFHGGPNVYDDVNIKNGLDNFWRSAENFTVYPDNNNIGMTWAVSQAAPLRKVYIKGNLTLYDIVHTSPSYSPMTSGGFISDCKVEGKLDCGSQQQFLFRNCEFNVNNKKYLFRR